MSKLHLINEISTAIKMAGEELNETKLHLYLDDLLSNYEVKEKDEEMGRDETDDLLHMYMNTMKLENYSFITITNYMYELRRYVRFIQKPVLKATTADVRQYLAAHGHLKSSTIGSKLSSISAFYQWLIKEEVLLKSPTAKIKAPKQPGRVQTYDNVH